MSEILLLLVVVVFFGFCLFGFYCYCFAMHQFLVLDSISWNYFHWLLWVGVTLKARSLQVLSSIWVGFPGTLGWPQPPHRSLLFLHVAGMALVGGSHFDSAVQVHFHSSFSVSWWSLTEAQSLTSKTAVGEQCNLRSYNALCWQTSCLQKWTTVPNRFELLLLFA